MQLQVDVPTLILYLQLFFVDGSKKKLKRKENRVEERANALKPLDRLKGIPSRFSSFFALHLGLISYVIAFSFE